MNSLRSRLVVGSALVAVVPLAVVMVILSQRVERMVRAQAAERLTATLGGLRDELKRDGERTTAKLEILARDAQLKRLYLVRPAGGRDLRDYLEERRFLLDLDVLSVTDTAGHMVADASDARMDGSSPVATVVSAPIQYQGETMGAVHGGHKVNVGFLARLKQRSGVELTLLDTRGRVLVTTLDAMRGTWPSPPPAGDVVRVTVGRQTYLSRSVPLAADIPATITGLVPTAEADRTIAALQATSVLLGVLGLAIAVLLGLLWSSQVSRPVERLAAFSDQVARGEWEQPLDLRSVRELETLVASLERMRLDLKASRDRLVVSERQAAWSQMARTVAHEIKNPLTPIAISVADLKRSYEAKRDDFPQILDQAVRTIADEVDTLKRLLQEFSDFARFPPPRPGPCRVSDLLADLETLYGREVAEHRLVVTRPARDVTFQADAGQVRQALVNLVKNALEASEGNGRVEVSTALDGDALTLAVSDTGPGLTAEQRAQLFVPGFTTKAQGSGLGLTIVERIVSEHGGTITADSRGERGTTFRVRLPLEPGA
jgi:nitrogen fixation/metabolism regulation signal transduction histidine kinase